MPVLRLLVVFSFVSVALAATCSSLSGTTVPFTRGSVCLRYFSGQYRNGWQASRDYCRSWHPAADLPVPHSLDDLNHIWNVVQTTPFWLGGTDASQEGSSNWWWVDGSPWDYAHWNGGQPDDWNGEDCAEVHWANNWMNDDDCGQSNRKIICMVPVADLDLETYRDPTHNIRCQENKCWCDWEQTDCPEPYGMCEGVHYPDACSGHGLCDYNPSTQSLNGQCVCDPNYGDASDCSIWWCHGKRNDWGDVCHGSNGTCSGYDECQCEEGFMGVECESVAVCSGVPWDHASACSGHGECLSEGGGGGGAVCHCFHGYTGDNCEYFACNGLSEIDELVCSSGNGECTGPDNCTCDIVWKGQWCEIPVKCGAYDWNSVLACRSRGDCVAEDRCVCSSTSYSGNDCEIVNCYGISSALEDEVCNNGNGICWDLDQCMCHRNFYGAKCEEHFPADSALVSGLTTDIKLTAFVPYEVPVALIPSIELPIGSSFRCFDRLIDLESSEFIGENAMCSWVEYESAEKKNLTIGVNFTFTDTHADVFVHQSKFDILFTLLYPINWLQRVQISLIVEITEPRGTIERDTFQSWYVAVIIVPLLLIICVGCVVVGTLFFYVGRNRARTRHAMEKMEAKTNELRFVHETMVRDTERLKNELRLQQIKGVVKQDLPDEFVQISGLDEENEYKPLRDLPRGKCWSKCIRSLAMWKGHRIEARSLDTRVAAVKQKTVDELLRQSFAFAKVPPHPHLRKFLAFYIEGAELGDDVKKAARGTILLQHMVDEYDKAEERIVADHAVLCEEVGENVIDYLWRRRREAAAALPDGVSVKSGVPLSQKTKWLRQIASALCHLHSYGVVLVRLNIHSLRLDADDNVKVDLPFFCRPPPSSSFASPEIVLQFIRGGESSVALMEKSAAMDVYSFGMVLYSILTETKRPFRSSRATLKPEEEIGDRASRDEMFRPTLSHSLLPDWAVNVLPRIWSLESDDRIGMSDLRDLLVGVDELEALVDPNKAVVAESSSSEFSSGSEDETVSLLHGESTNDDEDDEDAAAYYASTGEQY